MPARVTQRVAIATLGCKVNQFETADLIEQFRRAGWELVPFSAEADIYVINTCTVTGRSDSESRRLIRRARRRNPEAHIVATGCYAQVRPEELAALPELDQVLGNEEKLDLVACIVNGRNQVSDLHSLKTAGPLRLTSHTEHTRAFLQVQTGCEQHCSYCIVPAARGPNRSVPPDEVRRAVQGLAEAGFQEVVLTGIHLGAYGGDLTTGPDFTGLVRLLDQDGCMPRIRLGSLEPNEVSSELLDLIAGSPRICHHLHLPLQSGSDGVLIRMRRTYDAALYRRVVTESAARLPDLFLAADVIAGFPGESQAEFEETCSLIDELPLADLHVFPYSRRPGTPAAELPGQLPPTVISSRAEQLRLLAAAKKQRFQAAFFGKRLPVLGLKHHAGMLTGLSRNYLEVRYSGEADQVNKECEVEITGCDGTRLTGRLPQTEVTHA